MDYLKELILSSELTPTVTIDHGERLHARLSASGTSRWWNCLGSTALTADIPNRTSVYAEEGTAAHEVGNMCLEQHMDAIEFVGRTVNDFEVTVEMAEAVQVYLDVCRSYRTEDGWEVFVERKFTLERLRPPTEMFGTADFVAVNRRLRLMVVIDYKHGQGVTVAAEGNPQLRYYALGMVCALPDDVLIDQVEMAIVQPRGRGETIKRDQMAVTDLMLWSITLMERAEAALRPGAPLLAGSWCRFCPASGTCPEQANGALRIAQGEFEQPDPTPVSDADLDTLLAIQEGTRVALTPVAPTPYRDPVELATLQPPEVRLLTPAQVGTILHRIETFEEWVKGVRKFAHDTLEAGGEIPGWTTEPKRPTKYFTDPDDLVATLLTDGFGIPADKVWVKKLASPPQAVTALTDILAARGGTKKAAKESAETMLRPMWEPRSSGTNLVPVTETQPALTGRAAEFDNLPV